MSLKKVLLTFLGLSCLTAITIGCSNNSPVSVSHENNTSAGLPGYAQGASVVAMAQNNCSVFALSRREAPSGGFYIYQWKPQYDQWQTFRGAGVTIAIEDNGFPWVINSNHDLFRYNVLQSKKANDIAINKNGIIWMVSYERAPDGGYYIYKREGDNWTLFSGAGFAIAVDTDGYPWVINTYYDVYQYNGSRWIKHDIKAQDIAISNSNKVYVLRYGTYSDAGYVVYVYESGSWKGTSGRGMSVSAGNNVWVTNNYGDIFENVDGTWIAR